MEYLGMVAFLGIIFVILLFIIWRVKRKPNKKKQKISLLNSNFSSFLRTSRYWNCYTLFTKNVETTQSKYLKVISNNYFEIAIYKADDLSLLKSGLYKPNNNFVLKIKETNEDVYIFIWSRSKTLEAFVDDTGNTSAVEEIDRISTIDSLSPALDLDMSLVYQSHPLHDLFPDIEEEFMGPSLIGFKFSFDLNVGESVACIGYDLTEKSDVITLDDISVKVINSPGSHEEVESMFCRKYEMN